MSNVTVVFPGKRARLFMNQYLAQESESPVWAPQYQTIDELVQGISPYRKADTITSVCTLYNIYNKLVNDAEDLDEFYGWGEIILSDFDDIDKHMAPAVKIFTNVRDIHAITTDYVTEEQAKALREFFKNFTLENNTELKRRFLRLWDIMPDLYNGLNQQLKEKGMLYSGAQYRDVAERLKSQSIQSDKKKVYAFVGFNIVDESTEMLFRHFQQEHEALFYWDYDELYVKDQLWEAGLFINQDRKLFKNALDEDSHFDNLKNLKDITFIATSTSNAQSRYVPTWIKKHLTATENETAIVLADEHNLGSVLHSIPEDTPKNINVTMGYPLSDTPVFSFLNVLMTLYIDGYDFATHNYRHTAIEHVKRHPYFSYCSSELFQAQECDTTSLLDRLIKAVDEISAHYASKKHADVYDQLYMESLFQTHLVLTRFLLFCKGDESQDPILHVNPYTLRRLLFQLFSSTSIPFHGEPAIGMQVMGLLETRNIDFRNILMLNVGEGVLPKRCDDVSLIPHNLRENFGLTTMRHRISVFAYYFYRLISRAEHVTLMYNETSSGTTSNEMSRFMRQLMAETDLPIKFVRLMPSNNVEDVVKEIVVKKTPDIIELLRNKYIDGEKKSKLTPTAINTYLNCSLQFYYKYVAGIYVPEQLEDGITPPIFGTIFHDSAELFYAHLIQQYGTNNITAEILKKVLDSPDTRLFPFISISMIINFFSPIDEKKKAGAIKQISTISLKELRQRIDAFHSKPENANLLTGITHIIHGVLRQYLLQLVRYDFHHAPFTIEALEADHTFRLQLANGGEVITGGRIDRMDRDANGRLTIVDYKTGGRPEPIKDIETIFKHEKKNAGYYLQLFIYALAIQQEKHNPDSPLKPEAVCPTLFYVNRANRADTYERTMYIGTAAKQEPITDISPYSEEFLTHLSQTVSDIFSPDISFCSTEKENACKYCDFKQLCSR